jgi:hypothetical protein
MKNHTHTGNNEWGRKARKEEDQLRGLNAKDARLAITEDMWAMICPTCGHADPDNEHGNVGCAR